MNAAIKKNIVETPSRRDAPTFVAREGEAPVAIRDDFDRDVWSILGVPIDVANINDALGAIDLAKRTGERLSIVTPNVNWFVRSFSDQTARAEMIDADLSLVDGAPLVKIAQSLGAPITSRVAGSDLFEALRRRPGFASSKIKVFFFGGRDGAAETAVEALNKEGGGVEAVGSFNPGFGDVESMSSDAIIDTINASNADFVVVALGAAKGQAWITHNIDRLEAPVVSHLGAVVDFTAGSINRAPAAFQRSGLEWLWRIKEEPSLWVRYAKDAMALGAIAMTRILPALWAKQTAGSNEAAHAIGEFGTDVSRIKLQGALRHGELGRIRQLFREAAARGRNVEITFDEGCTADAAFLGQYLMLEKQLTRAGKRININALPKTMRSQFRRHNIGVEATNNDLSSEGTFEDQALAS